MMLLLLKYVWLDHWAWIMFSSSDFSFWMADLTNSWLWLRLYISSILAMTSEFDIILFLSIT